MCQAYLVKKKANLPLLASSRTQHSRTHRLLPCTQRRRRTPAVGRAPPSICLPCTLRPTPAPAPPPLHPRPRRRPPGRPAAPTAPIRPLRRPSIASAGVKFDPTDQELLEHLEGKARPDARKLHPLIDEFIPTIEGENGICYTHPERLPGE